MNKLNIWDKYEKIGIIDLNGNVFKAKNKENWNYVAIKSINKLKFENENKYLSKMKIMNELKTENPISIFENIWIIKILLYYYGIMIIKFKWIYENNKWRIINWRNKRFINWIK